MRIRAKKITLWVVTTSSPSRIPRPASLISTTDSSGSRRSGSTSSSSETVHRRLSVAAAASTDETSSASSGSISTTRSAGIAASIATTASFPSFQSDGATGAKKPSSVISVRDPSGYRIATVQRSNGTVMRERP